MTKPTAGRYVWAATTRIASTQMDSSGSYVTDGKKSIDVIRDELRQHCGEELARRMSMDPSAGRRLADLVRLEFTAA